MNPSPKPIQNDVLSQKLWHKIDHKTKPLKSLGRLEEIAHQVGLIQESLSPKLKSPKLLVFAADHGIAEEGVSAYPPEVTYQMVQNFLNRKACINSFCDTQGLDLLIIDAGVKKDSKPHPLLKVKKTRRGSRNMTKEAALTLKEVQTSLKYGADVVEDCYQQGTNWIGLGEMGIGNTSVASLWMHLLSNIPLESCIGKGTGIQKISQKKKVLLKVLAQHGRSPNLSSEMANYGGIELLQLCGAMGWAAHRRMVIMIDGFVVSVAYLLAERLYPHIKDYVFFSHLSHEKGHKTLLSYLQVKPLLSLDLRLGEGTGAALAYPLMKSALAFLNHMASFEEAGVSVSEN
ncbi:MAG: nicotinate-nucleotide--dimethylbenzimidazole phosphoribosyltransferase [Cytophagales bacterium]|nr:nicotinate-nucleotide--dimethylbenzimidazole phosphoribosyltransferase [Cytophagales bacterium]